MSSSPSNISTLSSSLVTEGQECATAVSVPRAPRSLEEYDQLDPFHDNGEPELPISDSSSKSTLSIRRSSTEVVTPDTEDKCNFEVGTSTMLQTATNFVNAVVGAGIVGLPYVFKLSGFLPGLVLLILMFILTDYSVRLLVRTGVNSGQRNYEDLCRHTLGKFGHVAVSVTMLIFDFGAMCSYLIILRDSGLQVMDRSMSSVGLASRPVMALILSCIFVLPLCLLRDLSRLEKASAFSCLTVVVIIGIVWYKMIDGATNGFLDETRSISSSDFTSFGDKNLFQAFGIVAFSFVCHDSSFLLFNTLKNNTAKRWGKVTTFSLFTALIIGLALAIPGYLIFGENTKDNLLDNFELDRSALICAVHIIYILTMALTYPISLFVCRHIINVWVFGGRKSYKPVKEMPMMRNLVLTLPIFFASVLVAMFVEKLSIVMSVAGALGGVTLAFVFPPLCNIVLSPYSIMFWKNEGHVGESVKELLCPLLLLTFGIIMIPVSVYQTITEE